MKFTNCLNFTLFECRYNLICFRRFPARNLGAGATSGANAGAVSGTNAGVSSGANAGAGSGARCYLIIIIISPKGLFYTKQKSIIIFIKPRLTSKTILDSLLMLLFYAKETQCVCFFVFLETQLHLCFIIFFPPKCHLMSVVLSVATLHLSLLQRHLIRLKLFEFSCRLFKHLIKTSSLNLKL